GPRLPDVRGARAHRELAAHGRRVPAVARTARVARAASARAVQARSPAGRIRTVGGAVIVLFNPLSTTPGKQPLPLSLMALAAVLEPDECWALVDGNIVSDPTTEIVDRLSRASRSDVRLLAVSVMPGPQLSQAVSVCRRVKIACPDVPIVWGGYFPT